ncbi:MAG: hypothetical protein ACLFPE_11190 [Bacteroidales bacterium]
MMKKFAILFLCFGFLTANATSWRVNSNTAIDADFSDLAAAIAAAANGDTLYVEGSLFDYGSVTVDKTLVLIGPGYFLDQNDSTQVNFNPAELENLTISQNAVACEIYGLYITGYVKISANDIIFARNHHQPNYSGDILKLAYTNATSNCVITQNYLLGIHGYNYEALNMIITNNYVADELVLDSDCSGTIFNNVVLTKISAHNSVVKNNITYDHNNGGYSGNNSVFEYNIANYQFGTMPPGPGNISGIDPADVFVDFDGTLGYSEDAKWQLKEGSIAIGYGENGVDCGCFGGTSPYVLSGLPAIPHIYEAIVPTSGSAASGLPVTIKVKSQN